MHELAHMNDKVKFGILYTVIFGLAIGLVAWISSISPSVTNEVAKEVISGTEDLAGIKYGYRDLEITAFVFFGLIIIISFFAIISYFLSEENHSKINVGKLSMSSGVLLTLLSIPLIVVGSLALEDNRRLNDIINDSGIFIDVLADVYKKWVPYKNLGISNLVGGLIFICIGIYSIMHNRGIIKKGIMTGKR